MPVQVRVIKFFLPNNILFEDALRALEIDFQSSHLTDIFLGHLKNFCLAFHSSLSLGLNQGLWNDELLTVVTLLVVACSIKEISKL